MCSNCGSPRPIGPSKSNGGSYVLVYTGDVFEISPPVVGGGTGIQYVFGTKKKEFYVDYRDVSSLFASEHGEDLRAR